MLTTERPSAVSWEATPHERPQYSPRFHPAQACDQALTERAAPERRCGLAEQSLLIPLHETACGKD
ncbi:MAG: hypothetical protein J7453_00750 [Thermomicrobium sp.]|nr:hypothetical protein [Thermomicrobium sp.]